MNQNRHAKRHRGYTISICLLAGVFLVCSVFLIQSGQTEYPKNPLIEQITNATELLKKNKASLDGDLQQTEEKTKSEEPESSREPTGSEEPTKSKEPTNSEEPTGSKEPTSSEVPISSEKPTSSEEPGNSEKPENSEEPGSSAQPGENGEKSDGPSKDGPGKNPGSTMFPGGTTDKIYFTTSIQDGEIVTESEYTFTITHKEKTLKVEEEQVYLNGRLWPQFQGRILLEEGENAIRVAVRYIEKDQRVFTVYKDYVVILKKQPKESPSAKPKESDSAPALSQEPKISEWPLPSKKPVVEKLTIISSLADQTVYEENFTFEAYVQGGMGHAVLEAKLNGAPITGEGTYKIRLKIGENRIRIRAYEEVNGQLLESVEQRTVIYVPVATDETRPYMEYINVTDGMTTAGDKFVLDLLPKDYLGSRIYAEGIRVRLNEKEYAYMWANEYTSYDLKLQAGENKLDIRITDKDGRYADYRYTIWCDWVKDGEPIGTAVLSVDADVLGIGFLLERTETTVYQGEALSFVIQRMLEEAGFYVEYNGKLDSGYYLSRITKEGIGQTVEIPGELVDAINDDGLEWKEQRFEDSLGEFDYCQGSGWVYSVNGHFTNFSPSQCFLKDGDAVRIRFTLAYGRDVGAGVEGKNYGIVWLQ